MSPGHQWDDPAFLAEARGWIESQIEVTGEIEQPHVRAWSTVLRVPTSGGDVWFKAVLPGLAHDVGVTAVLARLRPDIVLEPLAVDLERGWMLLSDGGERLREVLERERHPRRWYEIAPLYAELQAGAASAVEELLAAGTPDSRLDRVPELSDELAEALGAAPAPPAAVAATCDELASFGLPETIQHDDLHDGNVFVRPGGGYAVFDWGDSCITHPLASLTVMLDGVEHTFELGPRDPDLERIRDAYLEPWGAPRLSQPRWNFGRPSAGDHAAISKSPTSFLSTSAA